MPRVTHVLARLDAIDTKPRRKVNGPANSLRKIHLLWIPQTNATLDERLRVLDLIRKREPNAAWKLMLGILPQGHDTSSPSPMPRWRDFTADKTEAVTWALIGRGAAAISRPPGRRRLSRFAVRWSLLFDRLGDPAPNPDPRSRRLRPRNRGLRTKTIGPRSGKVCGGFSTITDNIRTPNGPWRPRN